VNLAQVIAFRNDMDADGNGGISLDEFLMAVRTRLKGLPANAAVNTDAVNAAWEAVLSNASNDPAQWIKDVENMFVAFDADGSGEIDVGELANGLASLGVSLNPRDLEAFKEDIDDDCNGSISLSEFLVAMRQRQRMANPLALGPVAIVETFDEEEMAAYMKASAGAWEKILTVANRDPKAWKRSVAAMFETFDVDHSAQIDVSELAAGLKSFGVAMTSEQLVAFRDDLDTDGDFRISKSEFEEGIKARKEGRLLSPAIRSAKQRWADEAWAAVVAAAADDPATWEASIADLFGVLDTDASGSIDPRELLHGLDGLGVKLLPQQLTAFRESLDLNKNGRVALDEFTYAVRMRMGLAHTVVGDPAADARAARVVPADPKARASVKNSSATASAKAARKQASAGVDSAWAAILAKVSDDPAGWQRSVDRLFMDFDLDGSGEIDVSELAAAVRGMGVALTADQLVAFRDDLDANFDGKVSRLEFAAALECRKPRAGASVAAWAAVLKRVSDHPKEWARSVEKLFLEMDRDQVRAHAQCSGHASITLLSLVIFFFFNISASPSLVLAGAAYLCVCVWVSSCRLYRSQ